MHAVFLAKLQGKPLYELQSVSSSSSDVKAPSGPLPPNVVPPRPPEPEVSTLFSLQMPTFSVSATPQAASGQQAEQPAQSTSTMATIGRWLGWNSGEPPAAAASAAATAQQPASKTKPAQKPTPASKPKQTETAQAPSQSPSQVVH
jgi:hypothetical protein